MEADETVNGAGGHRQAQNREQYLLGGIHVCEPRVDGVGLDYWSRAMAGLVLALLYFGCVILARILSRIGSASVAGSC
jgi:hypothetical protein